MTDDLRTRVERVILSHRMELADAFDNHWTCKCGATPMLYAAHLADAVIRELKLTREDWQRTSVWEDRKPPAHRYVTDWMPDE